MKFAFLGCNVEQNWMAMSKSDLEAMSYVKSVGSTYQKPTAPPKFFCLPVLTIIQVGAMVPMRKTMTTILKSPPANRRLSHRKASRSNVSVECRRGSLGLGKNLAAKFLDISELGVRIAVKEALTPGDEVEIVLHGFQVGKPIKRQATVCWALPLENGGCCVGLAFEKRLRFIEVVHIAKP